ncbi:MAG: NAD(P)/FAD-dependent oxidoreductase [Flavobacteriaceae bacterium]
MIDVIVVGGGAAGFFTAINLKEQRPELNVVILEKSNQLLSKVRISGGGRCNVTHACFIPKDLVKNYPRGQKELLGPFHKFMTGDVMEWFEERGVPLKIEKDNRIFPQANTSQAIIDCFMSLSSKLGIEIRTSTGLKDFRQLENGHWEVDLSEETLVSRALVLCPGPSKPIWKLMEAMDYKIVDPVPSLFTFNITDPRLEEIPGVAVPKARIWVEGSKLKSKGPVLITHWGLSGPGILKLSSLGARFFHEKNYNFKVFINWIGIDRDEVEDLIEDYSYEHRKNTVHQRSIHEHIPKRLWEKLLAYVQIRPGRRWGDLSKKEKQDLENVLFASCFQVTKKSTFKEEFVTAGGLSLKQINFKNFESKLHPRLYMAGEFIDIDAVTGGFNFQNAWTGGYLIAQDLSEKL